MIVFELLTHSTVRSKFTGYIITFILFFFCFFVFSLIVSIHLEWFPELLRLVLLFSILFNGIMLLLYNTVKFIYYCLFSISIPFTFWFNCLLIF